MTAQSPRLIDNIRKDDTPKHVAIPAELTSRDVTRRASLAHMLHQEDPRKEHMRRLGENIPKVLMNRIMVMTYTRPNKTAGGIWVAPEVEQEDIWQGKVGLVVAMGPISFVDDDKTKFGDVKPKVGDWVTYRMTDGSKRQIRGRATEENPTGLWDVRILQDVDIITIENHPDDVI